MVFNTNKEKGNSSLGIAIAYYSSNGYRKYIQFDKFIEVLNTLGYDTSEEQQLHSWFGRKHFLDYGASEAEIVAAIKREIVEIQNLLNS